MNNPTMVVAIVVAVLVVLAVAAIIVKNQRSKRLKSRFGPEYQRAVLETGGTTKAEAHLEKLAKRVERFHIVPLTPAARADFLETWTNIQSRFVDNPKGALTEADNLIQQIMTARGYPVTDFEQRAADISVDHPLVVEHYRTGHDIALRHSEGRATTEDMRQAMIHYRTLFAELVGEAEVIPAGATVRAARA
jgi:hypothetical protein